MSYLPSAPAVPRLMHRPARHSRLFGFICDFMILQYRIAYLHRPLTHQSAIDMPISLCSTLLLQ
jgi:hypothetical protein